MVNKRQRQGRVQADAHPGRSACVQSAALKDAKSDFSFELSEIARKLHRIRPDLLKMFRLGVLPKRTAKKLLIFVDERDWVPSFVYFIQGTEGGPVKIGYAVDALRRLEEIQRFSPVPLRILAVGLALEGRTDEAETHSLFAKDRLWGEWFLYTPLMDEYINGAVKIDGGL